METRTERRKHIPVKIIVIYSILFLFSITFLWLFVNGSPSKVSEETFTVLDIGHTEEGKEMAIIRRHGELVSIPTDEIGKVSKGDTLIAKVKGKEFLSIKKKE